MTLVLVSVAAGGFLGAPARHLAHRLVARRRPSDLPYGTLAVNVTGSLVLGLLSGVLLARHVAPSVQSFIGPGFCGAYTTFSTWTLEVVRLLEERRLAKAGGVLVAVLLLGLAVAGGGIVIGRALG